jgi:hypothetical protein
MVDGQGSPWWRATETNPAVSRPVLFYFSSCSKLLLTDFTTTNPPCPHIVVKGSAGNVSLIGVKLFAPPSDDPTNPSHNTDGVDFAETNGLFLNCTISTGDDNIAIGSSASNSKDILVTNCAFGEGHGLSIGSYTSGGVSNLTVINCSFNGTSDGIKVKSERNRGGVVQNLNYLNLTMTNVDTAMSFYGYYELGLGTITGLTPQFAANYGYTNANPSPYSPPIYRNITVSNVTANLSTAGRVPFLIWGLPDYPASNLVFKSVNLIVNSTKNAQIYNATNIQFVDCSWTMPSAAKIQTWNADVTFTNTALVTNLLMLDGFTTNGVGSSLEFDNARATIATTNALVGGALAFANSMLTVSNSLTLDTAMTLNYQLGATATTNRVAVVGNLALGGTVNISTNTGFGNGTYTLLTYTGSRSGSVPALGSTPSGHTCALNTNTVGQVNLIVSP